MYLASLRTGSRKSEKSQSKSENRVRGRNLAVGRRTLTAEHKKPHKVMEDRIRNDGMCGTFGMHTGNEKCLQKFAQNVPRQKITKETQARLKLYIGIGLRTEENCGQAQSVRTVSVWRPRPARCGHLCCRRSLLTSASSPRAQEPFKLPR